MKHGHISYLAGVDYPHVFHPGLMGSFNISFNKMDVIGHKAVGVKIKGTLGFLAFEKAKKLVVRIEYVLAIIGTGNGVIEPTGYSILGFLAARRSDSAVAFRMSIFQAWHHLDDSTMKSLNLIAKFLSINPIC